MKKITCKKIRHWVKSEIPWEQNYDSRFSFRKWEKKETYNANEFAMYMYCDACRGVHVYICIGSKAIMHEWTK